MGNAPGDPLGAFRFRRCDGSSSLFLGQLLRLSAADLDLARLGGLGNLMHEVDMQHAILKRRADDFDVVGEAEAPLESAPRDAAVQIAALLTVLFRLAGHQE